jgi:signal transduction histidine kinase
MVRMIASGSPDKEWFSGGDMNDGGTETYCGETELDRLRAQLAATEAKWAEQHLEAIARLAGGIAHDLNNLLVVIVSNAHLLRDRLGHDHPGLEEIEDILRATERATELTRRLLASGRKQTLHVEIVDLNTLLKRATPTLRRLLLQTRNH